MHICRYVPPWLCQIFDCMGFLNEFWVLVLEQLMEVNGLRIWDVRSLAFASKDSIEYTWLLYLDDESRICLGCLPNPALIKGHAMNNDNRSEDYWTSSAFEIDPGALQSQKSISSIGIPSDPQSSAGIQIDSPEYVNYGLRLWNQMRKQWVGNRRPGNKKQVGEPIITWDATYENLLGTDRPFPRPIPLGEMVEFLVDIWDLEGLYD